MSTNFDFFFDVEVVNRNLWRFRHIFVAFSEYTFEQLTEVDFLSQNPVDRKLTQWESTLYYVTSRDQGLQNKIERSELQIRTNSQKGTGTKIAEKLNNFEKFERKKVKFQPCS